MQESAGRVAALSRRPVKGAPAQALPALRLIAGGGIVGDVHFAAGDGSVSLLSGAVRAWMAEKGTPGLCFCKFRENLLLTGVDIPSLRPGDRLRLGEEAVLTVTAVGKSCYPGCALLETKTPCPLKSGAAFASVSQSGTVRVSDPVTVLRTNSAAPPPAP